MPVLEIEIPVIEGQRIGLRINNSNIVCAVHPGSAAANAGLCEDDVVVAVDGIDCKPGTTAVNLWSQGAGKSSRRVRVTRAAADEDDVQADATAATTPTNQPDAPPDAAATEVAAPPVEPPAAVSKPAAPVELSAEHQTLLTAAETFKTDGNRALGGGLTTLALGLYTKAIDRLTPPVEAEELATEHPLRVTLATCHSNRSSARLSLEQIEGALDDARAATKLRPDWVKGHSRTGDALMARGTAAAAAEAYLAALSLQPDSEQLRERLEAARAAAVLQDAQARMRAKALSAAEVSKGSPDAATPEAQSPEPPPAAPEAASPTPDVSENRAEAPSSPMDDDDYRMFKQERVPQTALDEEAVIEASPRDHDQGTSAVGQLADEAAVQQIMAEARAEAYKAAHIAAVEATRELTKRMEEQHATLMKKFEAQHRDMLASIGSATGALASRVATLEAALASPERGGRISSSAAPDWNNLELSDVDTQKRAFEQMRQAAMASVLDGDGDPA